MYIPLLLVWRMRVALEFPVLLAEGEKEVDNKMADNVLLRTLTGLFAAACSARRKRGGRERVCKVRGEYIHTR